MFFQSCSIEALCRGHKVAKHNNHTVMFLCYNHIILLYPINIQATSVPIALSSDSQHQLVHSHDIYHSNMVFVRQAWAAGIHVP